MNVAHPVARDLEHAAPAVFNRLLKHRRWFMTFLPELAELGDDEPRSPWRQPCAELAAVLSENRV
jgi:hypothetical protein